MTATTITSQMRAVAEADFMITRQLDFLRLSVTFYAQQIKSNQANIAKGKAAGLGPDILDKFETENTADHMALDAAKAVIAKYSSAIRFPAQCGCTSDTSSAVVGAAPSAASAESKADNKTPVRTTESGSTKADISGALSVLLGRLNAAVLRGDQDEVARLTAAVQVSARTISQAEKL